MRSFANASTDIERKLAEPQNESLGAATLEEMEALWQEAKTAK